MKELSTEEKAKRYEEVLAMAKECITYIPDEAVNKYMLNMFPELKESDGERIRKQIISFLKEFEYDHYRSLDFSSWIAWLKKQDFNYTFEIKEGHWYKCVCDYMLNNSDVMFKNDRLYYCRRDWRLRGEIDERNVKDIGVNGYKSFFRPATSQEIKDWLEKQGEQKPSWKPTEKQINAIRLARSFVTDDFGNNPTLSETLKELEKQLRNV